MDILLTHGYFLAEDAHERKYMKPYPTLGLLYLSAYLKRLDFSVAVFDATFAQRDALFRVLEAREAPVLGIYTNLITRPAVLDIVHQAKAAGWTVVLGGPESANYPANYLAAGADVVVFGEGEETLAELLPALARGGAHHLEHVAGIAFRDEDGAVVTTMGRPKIALLDALPWPDREAIDLEQYLTAWRTHHGAGSINLITARGCPYKCRWCSHAVFGYHHARRSPQDVAAEVGYLVERYRPDQLWYADDVFSINYRWLRAFTLEMRRRELAVPFECITRADRVTPEVVEEMHALGCQRVWLGSESGSQRILDAMERGVTVEEVRQATHMFRQAGIQVGMFLMWGYEGEDERDIEATIEHVKRSNPDIFLTTVAYPIQNTPYFAAVADRVVDSASWSTASDRDYQVRGRHSKRYYSFATQRLKHEVALFRLQETGRGSIAGKAKVALAVAASRLGMRLTADETEA